MFVIRRTFMSYIIQGRNLKSCSLSCSHLSCNLGTSAKKPTVVVEGNIASGKTVFLDYFSKSGSAFIVEEPLDKWTNMSGMNPMEKMYQDSGRWSMMFQSYVQLTMMQSHLLPIPPQYTMKLMERSIFSAKYIFATNLHKSGKMADVDEVILSAWFDWIVAYEDVNIDLIIYLRTDPEVCLQRLRKRGRGEESVVSLNYLQQLHDLYENWLVKHQQTVPAKVITLDCNSDISSLESVYEQCKQQIVTENMT